jgi:hypothetical protein
MSTTPAVRPQTITSADGTVRNVSDYDSVKDFPGQSAPCGMCGAWAHDAPEGVYGSTATQRTPREKNNGDPVWTGSHCFKCGNRGSSTPAEDLTVQYQSFLAFRKQYASEFPELTATPGDAKADS